MSADVVLVVGSEALADVVSAWPWCRATLAQYLVGVGAVVSRGARGPEMIAHEAAVAAGRSAARYALDGVVYVGADRRRWTDETSPCGENPAARRSRSAEVVAWRAGRDAAMVAAVARAAAQGRRVVVVALRLEGAEAHDVDAVVALARAEGLTVEGHAFRAGGEP